MNSEKTAEDNLKMLQKGSGKLYLLCLIVGALTGFTVSVYRWGLNWANHLRMTLFGRDELDHPMVLIGVWAVFLIVGALTGFTVSVYRWGLNWANHLRMTLFGRDELDHPMVLIGVWAVFIAIGLLVDFIAKKFPKTSGSGIPQVKGIILRQLDYGKWFWELIAKFVGGLLGIGCGLSLGREGPSVQLGSYIGYGATKLFNRNSVEKKYLVTSGASAGLAGAFGAPLAGVIFALEELHKFISSKKLFNRNSVEKKYLVTSGASAGLAGAFGAPLAGVIFALEELHKFISSKLLICTFMASIASDFVGRRMFGMQTAFDLSIGYPKSISPYLQVILFVLFGILIAFFGKLFTMTLIKVQDIYKGAKLPRWAKVSFVMTTSFIFCMFLPEVTGGGHELVEEMAGGNRTIQILIVIFIIKLLFTAISYATGFALARGNRWRA